MPNSRGKKCQIVQKKSPPPPLNNRLVRLEVYLEEDPDNLNLLAEIGDLALECGATPKARSIVRRALELRPDDPYFSLRLSSVAIAEGNYGEALTITEHLLLSNHTDPAVRYNRAIALVNLGIYADAKEILIELNAEPQHYPQVVRLLIRVHHYLGELPEAVALASEYLNHHPEASDVAGMLSLLYCDCDDLASADKWSTQALKANPNNLDALLAAGNIALGSEDSKIAKDMLHRAIAVQATNGRAWTSLGLADLLDLDIDAAHVKLLQAVKYMPQHIGTWHILAWIQLLKNDIDGAEESFKQALALDENFGETHGGLATVAAARGNFDDAERLSKVARRLNPNAMSAHYAQALRLQRQGSSDVAERIIKSALSQGKAPLGGNLLDMAKRVTNPHRRK